MALPSESTRQICATAPPANSPNANVTTTRIVHEVRMVGVEVQYAYASASGTALARRASR